MKDVTKDRFDVGRLGEDSDDDSLENGEGTLAQIFCAT